MFGKVLATSSENDGLLPLKQLFAWMLEKSPSLRQTIFDVSDMGKSVIFSCQYCVWPPGAAQHSWYHQA